MFWTILSIVLTALGIISFLVQRKEKKEIEQRIQQKKDIKPKAVTNTGMVYLDNQEHEEEFFEFYKKNFNIQDNWKLTNKELKEDFEGERVYKYYPYHLDYEIVGNDVLATLGKDKVKIGTLTDEQVAIVSENNGVLNLYQNIYKEVDDTVEINEDYPFFGFYVKKFNVLL